MLKSIFIISLFFCLIGSKKEKNNYMKYKNQKELKVTSLFFPSDDGKWTDKIVSSFISSTVKSHLPVEFQNISWAFGQSVEKTVEKIVATNPDVIFLPDDEMYKQFAKRVHEITGAFIIFASFRTDLNNFNQVPSTAQAGVYNNPPIEAVVTTFKKLFPLKKMGIVSGPWSGTMIDQIKSAVPNIVAETIVTGRYEEYSRAIQEYAKKYDAVWVLAPFGVLDESGKKWVASNRVQALLDSLDKPTIGWGNVGEIKRTVEMGVSASFLGENAAYTLINMIKDDHISIEKITSYHIQSDEAHLKKLEVKVPDELIGTIAPRS